MKVDIAMKGGGFGPGIQQSDSLLRRWWQKCRSAIAGSIWQKQIAFA